MWALHWDYLGLIYSQIFMNTSSTIYSSMVYDAFYLIFCEKSISNNFYFTWVILRKLNARPNTRWKPVISVFLSQSRPSTISSNSFNSNQTNLFVNGSGLTYDSQEGIWKSLLFPQSISIFFLYIRRANTIRILKLNNISWSCLVNKWHKLYTAVFYFRN